MRKILLILSGILFCFTGISQSIAPQVYATSGDHYTGTNAQLSFTIGEPVIETVSNTNNIITQGFHQTNYDITNIKENPDLGFNISVFPNPVTNTLQINISSSINQRNQRLKIELMDIMGKTIIKRWFSPPLGGAGGGLYHLNMREYVTGSYFLRITNEKEQLIKSFKIQKIN